MLDFHKEISLQDRLATTIANSVDPLHPRFCPSSCAFPVFKVDRCRHRIASKKSWRRTPKQRPIDGGGDHLASKTDHFFSATQPHKGNRIIETYGAGDGNRTHVRSLGSLQSNSRSAGLAAFFRFSEGLNWKMMERETCCKGQVIQVCSSRSKV